MHFIYYLSAPRTDFAETMTEFEMNAMAAHFDYIQQLAEEGTLILAGRPEDLTLPAVAIIEAADTEAAYHVMRSDPAVATGAVEGKLTEFKVAASRKVAIV